MNILTNTQKDYKRWEDKKLESFTQNISDLTVEIRNPNIVSKPEKSMVISILEQHNLVFFHINNNKYADKSCIKKLAHDLGLGDYEYDSKSDVDGLTEIKDHCDEQLSTEYIPYTNKELKWHTDGYYNDESNSILSWLLFCRSQAEKGGKNKYFDHEIAYILFNHESKHLGDLMKSDAYCIPKNSMTDRKEIYNLARKSYLVVKDNPEVGSHDMIHTENFVLVDKERRIRGFYDGTNIEDMNKIISDIKTLLDSYKKS